MKANQLINQIKLICEHHNVELSDVTVMFDNNDFDLIPEFENNILKYHTKGYLKTLCMDPSDDDKLATEVGCHGTKVFPPEGYLIGKITDTKNGMLVEFVKK